MNSVSNQFNLLIQYIKTDHQVNFLLQFAMIPLMRTTLYSSKNGFQCGQRIFHSPKLRNHIREVNTTPMMMGRRSAKIATRKGKADAQKAKLYGKIGKLIAQAVRSGGADPIANQRLREVLLTAKTAQLPTDIIERNLKKASEKNSADFSEMVYEAYGPGGTGFIIEALTDNVNRTASEVRAAVTKGGGKMADVGSVLFNFSRTGLIMVDPNENEDSAFEAALDAGATDMQPSNDDDGALEGYKVLTSVESYASVLNSLTPNVKISMEASGLVYIPLASVEVNDDDYGLNEGMFERLLAVDDVDAVYTNFQ